MPEENPATVKNTEGLPRTQAGLADERFAANVRQRRERAGMSQGDLARIMAAGGFHWHPQTVHKVETGARKVSVGEAKALAEILETTVDRLTLPGREASAASLLMTFTARADRAYQQVGEWTYTLRHAQWQLEYTVAGVEREDYFGSAEVRKLADDARRAMELTPEDAVDGAGHPADDAPGEEGGGERS